jgi:hypothetical protein
MSHDWPDGEGPSDRAASREHVRMLLDKPEHQAAKGSRRDESTRDDTAIDDPDHQQKNKP